MHIQNNNLRDIAYLPLRAALPNDPTNAKLFTNFYKIDVTSEEAKSSYKKCSSNMFYFTQDDDIIFKDKFGDEEKLFRNNLRQELDNKMGITFEINKLQTLNKYMYQDENKEESSFIQQKINRYEKFKTTFLDFILSFMHTLYWQNFQKMRQSGETILYCLEKAIDIGKVIKTKFEEQLEEEFNTQEYEKMTNMNITKSYLASKPKKLRKHKDKQGDKK